MERILQMTRWEPSLYALACPVMLANIAGASENGLPTPSAGAVAEAVSSSMLCEVKAVIYGAAY